MAIAVLAFSACGAPDQAPETSFELTSLPESDASELAERVGQTKDCAPVTFIENEDHVTISCLSDVPLGQATDTLTLYCERAIGWIVVGGVFTFDSAGGDPLEDCDAADPMQ